ncbi:MAG: histidine--tRNA ligase [Asgard group archaeon]|nr:histidine--tRNA ligase [Asgard group archaeon]
MSPENNNRHIDKPSGFRDFYPEDFQKVRFILDTMRRISQKFGYVEYHSPAVELRQLFELKSGEDIVGEMFELVSRSDQDLVLIPELTPSLSRMLAEMQLKYSKPIRWFSLPKCYRDETLQRGRVKEFWQYNIDILGVEEVYADAEIITILVKVINECGLTKDQFVVLINDREFMQAYFEAIGISDFLRYFRALDKKDKIVQEKIQEVLKDVYDEGEARSIAITIRHATELDESIFEAIPRIHETEAIVRDFPNFRKKALVENFQSLGATQGQAEKLYQLATLRGSPTSFLKKAEKLFPEKEAAKKALENLRQLAILLKGAGIADFIEYDGSLARGLDYYTGIIFEAWSRDKLLPRAIAGGGRYDDLVSTLGGQPLPGTGFGFGDTVLLELLEEFKVKIPEEANCDIYIAPIKILDSKIILDLAMSLREEGFRVIQNSFDWKIKRHFENAEKQGVKWMIIIGKKDLSNNQLTLRNIISGEQEKIPLDKAVSSLKERIK